MKLNPYAHDIEEKKNQIKILEQMAMDLYIIQMDNSGDNKWDTAFNARIAICDLKHLIMRDLGLRD